MEFWGIFFRRRLRSRFSFVMWSLLTLTLWLMKVLALDLVLVIVQPLWDMASLGELVSRVQLRSRMTFHTSGSSSFDIELCRRSIQLLALVSLVAKFAFRQASICFCWYWWILWCRRLRLWIFARTCGLIQGFSFFLDLVLLTWSEAKDMRMLLNHEISQSINQSIYFLDKQTWSYNFIIKNYKLWYNLLPTIS